eukprot:1750028-Prymnesium_polylepis.2
MEPAAKKYGVVEDAATPVQPFSPSDSAMLSEILKKLDVLPVLSERVDNLSHACGDKFAHLTHTVDLILSRIDTLEAQLQGKALPGSRDEKRPSRLSSVESMRSSTASCDDSADKPATTAPAAPVPTEAPNGGAKPASRLRFQSIEMDASKDPMDASKDPCQRISRSDVVESCRRRTSETPDQACKRQSVTACANSAGGRMHPPTPGSAAAGAH